MNKDEIVGLLKFNEEENKIFMPNEIFTDLTNFITKHEKSKEKVGSKIAFAYSYYYLISWLYRYAKYSAIKIDTKDIKSILGYSPTTTSVDCIIKKNGILDKLNYTTTDNDYPVMWNYDKNEGVTFDYMSGCSEVDKLYLINKTSRNYKIKVPLKGIHRTAESEEDCHEDGTFHDVSDTHLVEFETFAECMSNDNIGVYGFYIYSYLKYQNQLYDGGVDVSVYALSEETGVSIRSLVKYLDILKKYKLIDCILNQDYYVIGLRDADRKANTYITNDYDKFVDEPITYRKMELISPDKYKKMMAKLEGDNPSEMITLDELPY